MSILCQKGALGWNVALLNYSSTSSSGGSQHTPRCLPHDALEQRTIPVIDSIVRITIYSRVYNKYQIANAIEPMAANMCNLEYQCVISENPQDNTKYLYHARVSCRWTCGRHATDISYNYFITGIYIVRTTRIVVLCRRYHHLELLPLVPIGFGISVHVYVPPTHALSHPYFCVLFGSDLVVESSILSVDLAVVQLVTCFVPYTTHTCRIAIIHSKKIILSHCILPFELGQKSKNFHTTTYANHHTIYDVIQRHSMIFRPAQSDVAVAVSYHEILLDQTIVIVKNGTF